MAPLIMPWNPGGTTRIGSRREPGRVAADQVRTAVWRHASGTATAGDHVVRFDLAFAVAARGPHPGALSRTTEEHTHLRGGRMAGHALVTCPWFGTAASPPRG